MKTNTRIAFTGSAGFLGRALYKAFEGDYQLRLADVVEFDSPHETVIGDVSDPETCREIVSGMDMLVIAHMTRHPYEENPSRAFQVNVTGTVNLFHAAIQEGLQRICLISSTGVTLGLAETEDTIGDPPRSENLYSCTKACQEQIAQTCHIQSGLEVAVMRIGYVVDLPELKDKYGTKLSGPFAGMVDRHDVGIAARKFLELPELGYTVMPVFSISREDKYPGGLKTFELLNWTSEFNK